MDLNPLLVLIPGSIVAFILLIAGISVSVSTEKAQVEERLGRYTERERGHKVHNSGPGPVAVWVNKQVVRSSFGDRIAKDLARADLKMKPGEYVMLIAISVLGTGFIGWFVGGQSILVGVAFAIIGAFLPGFYVKNQQTKRLTRFNDQLGDMLNLMVNGLRAGYSTTQAMEAVSKELPAPICDEFRRVIQEIQLGVAMEVALDNLLRRIPSDDLDLVITAINVQREVGGNLAEILDSISYTIRERVRIKGEIRVLTSQVMYSGRFLSLLPIIVVGILFLLNREYMMEFFKPENVPCGYIALGATFLLIISGYFAMNKLAEIEI